MTWRRAKFGSVLTENRDGSLKTEPKLWTPAMMQILIPPGAQDHARPFIRLEGKSEADLFTMILFEDHVMGAFQGQTKRLVEL